MSLHPESLKLSLGFVIQKPDCKNKGFLGSSQLARVTATV